jgi:hypothetical protein
MSFYAIMDRAFSILVSACFSVVSLLAGCGDAGAPRIDGPGAHSNNSSSGGSNSGGSGGGDAASDQGNGYKDPTTPDAGCAAPNAVCSGVCIAVGSDPSNCGSCGNACIGTDAVCFAGKCSCSGQLQDYCDGVGCMDVSSDFNNCGACGNACDPNNDQACQGGVCIPNCCN